MNEMARIETMVRIAKLYDAARTALSMARFFKADPWMAGYNLRAARAYRGEIASVRRALA